VPPGIKVIPGVVLLGIAPVFFVGWFIVGRRHDARRWASTAVLLAAVTWIYVNALVVPTFNARHGVDAFARAATRRVQNAPVRAIGDVPPQVDFMMDRTLEPIQNETQMKDYVAGAGARYLVTGPDCDNGLLAAAGKDAFETVLESTESENRYALLKKAGTTP